MSTSAMEVGSRERCAAGVLIVAGPRVGVPVANTRAACIRSLCTEEPRGSC